MRLRNDEINAEYAAWLSQLSYDPTLKWADFTSVFGFYRFKKTPSICMKEHFHRANYTPCTITPSCFPLGAVLTPI